MGRLEPTHHSAAATSTTSASSAAPATATTYNSAVYGATSRNSTSSTASTARSCRCRHTCTCTSMCGYSSCCSIPTISRCNNDALLGRQLGRIIAALHGPFSSWGDSRFTGELRIHPHMSQMRVASLHVLAALLSVACGMAALPRQLSTCSSPVVCARRAVACKTRWRAPVRCPCPACVSPGTVRQLVKARSSRRARMAFRRPSRSM